MEFIRVVINIDEIVASGEWPGNWFELDEQILLGRYVTPAIRAMVESKRNPRHEETGHQDEIELRGAVKRPQLAQDAADYANVQDAERVAQLRLQPTEETSS